jgi:hypothetical protein
MDAEAQLVMMTMPSQMRLEEPEERARGRHVQVVVDRRTGVCVGRTPRARRQDDLACRDSRVTAEGGPSIRPDRT